MEDCVNNLIDSADTLTEMRRKELYWMYKLKTYARTVLKPSEAHIGPKKHLSWSSYYCYCCFYSYYYYSYYYY